MATYYVQISPYAIWKRPFHVDFFDIYDISPLTFIQIATYKNTFFLYILPVVYIYVVLKLIFFKWFFFKSSDK